MLVLRGIFKRFTVTIILCSLGFLNLAFAKGDESVEPDPNRQTAQELRCLAQYQKLSIKTPLLSQSSELQNIYAMSFLSTLAYENRQVIDSVAKELGFTQVKQFEIVEDNWPWFAHTRGFFAENDHEIVLVFEGTNPQWHYNFGTDLDAIQISMGRLGMVHRGFYRALDIAWNSILQGLTSSASPKPLFIAGHSLGASLATLAAARLLELEFEATTTIEGQKELIRAATWTKPYVAALYTFGSPEVGDMTFRDQMNQFFSKPMPIFVNEKIPPAPYSARVINENDIIPNLPGIIRYSHIDKPFLLTADAKLEELNPLSDWSIVQPSISVVEQKLFNHEIDLNLHFPMIYTENIYRLIGPFPPACLTVN